jgi:UDP-sugar transporter A1/2/3
LASKARLPGPALPPPSLALRNLQLALISIPFALIGVFGPEYDRHRVLSRGLLDGFSRLGYFVVLNQALGGLLIASVVKEADSVSKGFATSIAILRESMSSD